MGKEKIPAKRFGEIEELANLASYLVSDYANFMNGEVNDYSYIVHIYIFQKIQRIRHST